MAEGRVTELNNFREQLTEDQRTILNAIWDYFLTHHQWIPVRVLHQRFGKATARSALEQLGGSIVFEARDSGKECYQLSFLGVLLTHQGEEGERLLVKYLEYLRQRFLSDPEIERVTSQEVEAALRLDTQKSSLLNQLINISRLWGGSSSHGPEGWTAGMPDDVDDLPSIPDLRAYVQAYALKNFDPAVPVDERVRIGYFLGTSQKKGLPSEFAFIRDPGLQSQLSEDWQEAQAVHGVKAWKSCVVLCGGILEGMLFDAVSKDEQRAREAFSRLRHKSPPKLERWDLKEFVDVAEEMSILSKGTVHLGHALREFRNLIHPGRQMRQKVKVTEKEANIALDAVRICIRELASLAGGEKQQTQASAGEQSL